MSRGLCAGVVVAAIAVPTTAGGQDFPPVTDRDFALDLYNGSALGSLQMVGMGGAAVAIASGSAGMSVNPASIGVRPPTSTGTWDWDVHADWLNPGIGTDRDNNGIEAFSRNQLQVSGDRTVASVRAGAEYEWLPGRLRVRGGSYYEPGRFRDPTGDVLSGRLHVTAGLDLRVWQFQILSWKYRLRMSLTADVAERYTNGGLSIGFWR